MSQGSNRILLWITSTIVIIGSFLAIMFSSQNSDTTLGVVQPVSANEWIKGNPQSKIILIEYSDFQCPACASREPLLKELLAEFGNHISFVYRHFPLKEIHKNAQLAAQASEAAGLQDKFWEMHDLIFENQTTWSEQDANEAEDNFINYAQKLDLDIEKFKNNLDSNAIRQAVDEDYDSGEAAGVNATPTFFLNNKKINPANYDQFRAAIKEAIESTTANP